MGDLPGAVAQFRDTVRLAPPAGRDETAAKAHYSLGVLMASAGLGPQAIEHLTAAVAYNPNYVEALVALADALRRQGRVADSLTRYQEALQVNPRSQRGAFRLWHRPGPAAAVSRGPDLVRGGGRQPSRRARRQHALARLLAAAPDDQARDGARGLALVQQIMSASPERTTGLGETFAMALAEAGDYTQAASVQREVLAAARRRGLRRRRPPDDGEPAALRTAPALPAAVGR